MSAAAASVDAINRLHDTNREIGSRLDAIRDTVMASLDLTYVRETSLESGSGPTELELVDFITRSLAQVREARRQLAILRKGR